jgi:hypothetical protein
MKKHDTIDENNQMDSVAHPKNKIATADQNLDRMDLILKNVHMIK